MKFDKSKFDPKSMVLMDVPNGGVAILNKEGYILAYSKERVPSHMSWTFPRKWDWVNISYRST